MGAPTSTKLAASTGQRISPDELIGAARLYELVGVSDMTIRRWNAAGNFPDPIVIGSRRFWRGADYLHWLEHAPRKRANVAA